MPEGGDAGAGPEFRRQWRYYRTASGATPVREYLAGLDPADRARIRLSMLVVAQDGRPAARHVRGDVYEMRAGRGGRAWRILFSAEGRFDHVLLALFVREEDQANAEGRGRPGRVPPAGVAGAGAPEVSGYL